MSVVMRVDGAGRGPGKVPSAPSCNTSSPTSIKLQLKQCTTPNTHKYIILPSPESSCTTAESSSLMRFGCLKRRYASTSRIAFCTPSCPVVTRIFLSAKRRPLLVSRIK